MNRFSVVMVTALLLTAVPAMAQLPGVTHIWPNAGINEQTATAHVYGGDFQASGISSVKLIKSGNPDIDGTSITVVSDEYLTCSFNLTGGATGLYDLVVTNVSGSGTLPRYFTVYSAPDSPFVWSRTTVGSGAHIMIRVAVEDGNGDGEAEVYGANWDNNISQFKWDGNSWVQDTLVSGSGFAHAVVAGDANGDAEMEVYGSYSIFVSQFKWSGAAWVETPMGNTGGSTHGIAVGDGNRDGELEVYAGGLGDFVYQFKWDGANWNRTMLGNVGNIFGVAVGDGNNDGELEVYASSGNNGGVYQFKWNGASWVQDTLGSGGWGMYGLAVGDGNGDGETEVYGGNDDGNTYQFKWNGVIWVQTTIDSGVVGMEGIAVGDGDGDGEAEVYGASGEWLAPGKIYQLKWNGISWQRTTVGSGSDNGEMYGISIGDGNNDGQIEVYGTNQDHNLYQFKPASIPVITLSDTAHDFGSVPFGDSLDWQYLVVKNIGVDTLLVDSLQSDAVDYVVIPSFPDTLLPDDSTLVTVRFKPSVLGTIVGTLTVYSNDPDRPVIDVSLTGIGIDATPPTAFSLISPADSAVLAIVRPTFVWGPSSDALSGLKDYEIYIDVTLRDSTVDTFWTADYDLAEGWHDWYTVAYDSAGNPQQSTETWSVLVDTTPPSPVSLVSPFDGAYLNNNTVDFSWNQSTDNLSGVDHYLLQYTPDSTFLSGVVETTLVETTSTALLSDTTYYWRAKAVDVATNETDWSSVWDFEIDTLTPAAPTLVSPLGGVYLSDSMVGFEWIAVLNLLQGYVPGDRRLSPIEYVLQVDTSVSFTDPVAVDTVIPAYDTLMLVEGDYFWRTKAYDLAGNDGPFSDPDSFGVDLTAPVIESTSVWSDTSYVGPFEILTKVTDNLAGVDSVVLYYMRDEDPGWASATMNLSGPPDWYLDSIPAVGSTNDTVRYYIGATDLAQPANAGTDPPGAPGSYYWFVSNVVGVEEAGVLPRRFFFGLGRNPARGTVAFNLEVPEPAEISLHIYDVTGRLVGKPLAGTKSAGIYEVLWVSNAGSGVYFYSLESPWETRSGKFILMR